MSDAEAVLLHSAGRHYTFEELSRMVGREKMEIQSSYSQHFWDKGRDEGRIEAERELCIRMVREYHPALAAPATAMVQSCSEPALLADWVVAAPRLTDEEFARLLRL